MACTDCCCPVAGAVSAPAFFLIMKTLLKENKTILFWLILGSLYYFFVKYMSLSLPCPFRYVTGYLCPGCGITTMVIALGEGDFDTAKKANAFLFYTLFWLLLSVLVHKYCLPKRYVQVLDKWLYPVYFLLLIGFGVYRNL